MRDDDVAAALAATVLLVLIGFPIAGLIGGSKAMAYFTLGLVVVVGFVLLAGCVWVITDWFLRR